MGLRDRVMAKYVGRDFPAEVGAALVPGDQLLGTVSAIAAAHQRSVGPGVRSSLTTAVVRGMQDQLSKANHVGGEPGSIAMRLPRDHTNAGVLALTDHGLSMWAVSQVEGMVPTRTIDLPRPYLVSITKLDSRIPGRGQLMRVVFHDGSFFDYFTTPMGADELFWTAAAAVRPAR